MKQRSLKEWNAKGRRVRKGSKAVGFNAKGEALFIKDQTWKPDTDIHACIPDHDYYHNSAGNFDYDSCYGDEYWHET